MSEGPLDDLGSFDAGDDAQRAATHTTVLDVDVEDALEAAASSSWGEEAHGARGRLDGQGWERYGGGA